MLEVLKVLEVLKSLNLFRDRTLAVALRQPMLAKRKRAHTDLTLKSPRELLGQSESRRMVWNLLRSLSVKAP